MFDKEKKQKTIKQNSEDLMQLTMK